VHDVALDLLILLVGIWIVAVTLRPLGLPTVMGELIVGVVVGPAVLGWIEPNDAIRLLADIGIFFLMLHAGLETQPVQFYDALKRSLGVAVVGAIVPFAVSFGVATLFGLDVIGATFIGLTMTATAVVITLKSLKDLGLANTRVARVIVASCVIDDLLTLVVFGLVIGMLSGGEFDPMTIVITIGKVVSFFGAALLLGRFVYPRLTLPFRSEGGKGFTFVLLAAIAAGLFAEAIGLHMILGAYLVGLFFEEKVAHPNLVKVVTDRSYGIAYSFLGPIFFISLGFSITFDISGSGVGFLALLTSLVIVGQILSAGGMALRMGMPPREALTVGVGMCGRAELAFILASLALAQGAIDQPIFSILIFTAFLLNLFTPLALKGCAVMLQGKAARVRDATRGVVQIDKFGDYAAGGPGGGRLPSALPDLSDTVVVYGYGPEVESLLSELEGRGIPSLVIEADETVARELLEREQLVVHASVEDESFDLAPLARARAVISNGPDDHDALLALRAREQGFTGPLVVLIDNPGRGAPMLLAGASIAFTPRHVLAAVLSARASARVGPRVTGTKPLQRHLEVAELRVHSQSPLADKTLKQTRVRTETGANIVGRWVDDDLRSPDPDAPIEPGTILVAVGDTESIERMSQLVYPIKQVGPIVVVGFGIVGRKVAQLLTDSGEAVHTIDKVEGLGVDVVGDVLDKAVLERASAANARAIILALDSDSATVFAATVLRDYAPDVPIIARVNRAENVGRVQQAGVDYALSVSQVAGQLLAHHVLGETVSLQPRIKLVKLRPGALTGRHPFTANVRERTGCSIVAVERDGEIVMDIPPSLTLEETDSLYVCGTTNAVNRYYDEFPLSHQ